MVIPSLDVVMVIPSLHVIVVVILDGIVVILTFAVVISIVDIVEVIKFTLFGTLITQPCQHGLKQDLLEMKAVPLRIKKFF